MTLSQQNPSERQPREPAIKPTVIGIYGVPGCGKSFMLGKLRKILGDDLWAFFEGSEVIDAVTLGGLSAFTKFED